MSKDVLSIIDYTHTLFIRFMSLFQWKEGDESIGYVYLLLWTFLCFHPFLVISLLPLCAFLLLHYDPPTSYKPTSLVSFIFTTCLAWLVCTRTVVWYVGTVLLAWHSPVCQVIRMACHRAFLFATHVKSINQPTPPLDRIYCFKVIEHQRWWFHKGWIPFLLPHDRPAWSDEYLVQVPSIHEFQLPPATLNMTHQWQWTSTWQSEEWEYGSWDWQHWGSNSSTKLTRRRVWSRHAQLILVTPPLVIIPSKSSSISTCSSFEEECITPTSTFMSFKKQ